MKLLEKSSFDNLANIRDVIVDKYVSKPFVQLALMRDVFDENRWNGQ